MRKSKKIIRVLLILLVVGFVVGLNLKKHKVSINKSDFNIVKWDNFYNEKNINLYYGTSEKSILSQLNAKYKVNEMVSGEKDKLDKALKIMNWVKTNMNYDKNKKNKVENKGAADILSAKNKSKKYSNLEICTVFNELCNSENIICRIGEFTISNNEKTKDSSDLFVCEIWDEKYNKWIMIDIINGVYIKEKDTPLCAVGIMDKGIYNLKIVGDKKPEKYQKRMNKYFYNYTIKIDNTIYDARNSNCYITYIKDFDKNNILVNNALEYPSIYTKNKYLFEVSPSKENEKYNSDEIPTIIFSKIKSNKVSKKNETKEKVKMELCVGVFKNSSMEDKYYISINDSPFEQKNKYFNLKVKEGITNIKLSNDGKNVIREVTFQYKNK